MLVDFIPTTSVVLVSLHFQHHVAVLELVVVLCAVVERALERRLGAPAICAALATAVGPAAAVRDRDLGAFENGALGASAVCPTEPARLASSFAVVHEALDGSAWTRKAA